MYRNRHFSKEDIQNDQEVLKKAFNIGNYQGNAYQYHNEISPHRMPSMKKRDNKSWQQCEEETLAC